MGDAREDIMKVLLINGSPHKEGCTYTALKEIADTLSECGIDSEIYHIGTKPINGCLGCGRCFTDGKCVQTGDGVNELFDRLDDFDGLVVGSPVHYAGPAGNLCSFLDRLFYLGAGKKLYGKPAAAIASARRGGLTASFDRLNKYFTISCMPVVSSQYWNGVHGNSPEEVRRDAEGMQIMRMLARHMAYMVKCFEAGRDKGIMPPEREPFEATNFIR